MLVKEDIISPQAGEGTIGVKTGRSQSRDLKGMLYIISCGEEHKLLLQCRKSSQCTVSFDFTGSLLAEEGEGFSVCVSFCQFVSFNFQHSYPSLSSSFTFYITFISISTSCIYLFLSCLSIPNPLLIYITLCPIPPRSSISLFL